MTRRAPKTDRNQAEIVDALRKAGVVVHPTHMVGAGFPDLVCGYRGRTELLECKDGNAPPSARKLTPAQQEFIASWPGSPVHVVLSAEDALRKMGVEI